MADTVRHVNLVPGDVILTGTPRHSRSVDPGDLDERGITGIGRIGGTVTAIAAPRAGALGVGHAPADGAEGRRVAHGFDERVRHHFKDNLRKAEAGR